MLLVGIADRQSKGHPGITGDGIPVTVPLYLIVTMDFGKKCVHSTAVVVKKWGFVMELKA